MPTQHSNHFSRAAGNFDRSPISQQLSAITGQLMHSLSPGAHEHWLDFGAGTGLLSIPLAVRVRQVTALDTSQDMLDRLAAKQITNIETLNQDIFQGLPARYHGVVSSMALHHVADIPQLLDCLYRHLLPGGRIALVDLYAEDGSFHGNNRDKGVKHLGFIPQHLIRHAEEAGFTGLDVQELSRIDHRNGRSYPLFLLNGHKAGA